MKGHTWFLITGLLAGSMLWAQSEQSPNPPHEAGQSSQQEQRPTLGPRSGPGLEAGPLTSTTFDLAKLRRIHNLYIENIDNSLSDKLIDAIGKSGLFRLVTKAREADAILRGSCLESRRLKNVHSEVYINDRSGASVWQDTIYRPFNPPLLDKAVSETATLVVAHLERSLRGAAPR
jgi:hypothetical protein